MDGKAIVEFLQQQQNHVILVTTQNNVKWKFSFCKAISSEMYSFNIFRSNQNLNTLSQTKSVIHQLYIPTIGQTIISESFHVWLSICIKLRIQTFKQFYFSSYWHGHEESCTIIFDQTIPKNFFGYSTTFHQNL